MLAHPVAIRAKRVYENLLSGEQAVIFMLFLPGARMVD
jgi:hypothetical protein